LRLDPAVVSAALRPLLLSWQQPGLAAAQPAGDPAAVAAAAAAARSADSSSSSSSSALSLAARVALARQLCRAAGLHRIQAEQVRQLVYTC
jgi:hypothetical protein